MQHLMTMRAGTCNDFGNRHTVGRDDGLHRFSSQAAHYRIPCVALSSWQTVHARRCPCATQVAQLQLEVRSLRAAVAEAESVKPHAAARALLTSVTTAAAAVLTGVLVMAVLPGAPILNEGLGPMTWLRHTTDNRHAPLATPLRMRGLLR
jgi:hypothetical protein